MSAEGSKWTRTKENQFPNKETPHSEGICGSSLGKSQSRLLGKLRGWAWGTANAWAD